MAQKYGEIYFGSDGPSQQSVNPFGKGWDVTEAHFDVKIKLKHPLKLKPQEFLSSGRRCDLIIIIFFSNDKSLV